MKKIKLISVMLSLALIFSMTSAFTIASNADEATDNADLTKSSVPDKTVSKVIINGITLNDGDYILTNGTVGSRDTLPQSGYAYLNDGHLLLNSFSINATNTSGIDASADEFETLCIDLIGSNSITMGSGNGHEAILANNVSLVLSASSSDGKLTIDTRTNGLCAESIEIVSGTYKIIADRIEHSGLLAYSDLIISGGNITINKFDHAIGAFDRVFVNGGNIIFNDCGFGIHSQNAIMINDGELTMNPNRYCGIYSEYAINVNGGNIDIKNAAQGITCKEGNVIINDGTISMEGFTANAFNAAHNINIFGGSITLSKFGEASLALRAIYDINITDCKLNILTANKGLYCKYGNISINNSSLSMTDISSDAITAENNLDICGGSLTISNLGQSTTALFANSGNVNIEGAAIKISDENNDVYNGIRANSGNLSIDRCDIDISGCDYALYANYELVISNSVVDATGIYAAICSGYSIPRVNNSDVKARSTSTEATFTAFSPSANISGNPTVYVGSTEKDAKRSLAKSIDPGQYHYVHICNGKSVLFSKLITVYTNLIVSVFNLKNGLIISNTFIGKLLGAIFDVA